LDSDQSGEGILPVAEGKPFVKMLGDGHDEGAFDQYNDCRFVLFQ